MEFITYARPYAKAAFDYAKERGSLDRWEKMLCDAAQIVQNKKVETMLHTPKLSKKDKVTLLVQLLGENIDSGGKNLLNILSANNRLQLLPWIANQFSKLKAISEKRQEVVIASAYPLDTSHQDMLITKLAKRLGKKIEIKTVVDPSLIGGVKIGAGDWVYDDTLKARLGKLANAIIS